MASVLARMGCCCRVAGIKCCKYCKFKGGDSCQSRLLNKHNNHVCTVYYNAKFNKISKYIRSYRVVTHFLFFIGPLNMTILNSLSTLASLHVYKCRMYSKMSFDRRDVVILRHFASDRAFGTYHKLFLGVKLV